MGVTSLLGKKLKMINLYSSQKPVSKYCTCLMEYVARLQKTALDGEREEVEATAKLQQQERQLLQMQLQLGDDSLATRVQEAKVR